NMVLQYANDGNLHEYLKRNSLKLKWSDKLRFVREIALGLSFLHKHNIIHGDLNTQNIFVHDGKMMIAAHLMKKGTDHVYEPNRKSYADDRDESLSYVAPEVLLTKNTTYQTDIYSFGILLYEIMTSLSPHQILTPDNLNIGIIRICNGLRPVLPKNIPGPVEHLITQCWDSDPSRRP
ncbi:kinase-like domain-containing protein, partial [Gigaspora rosea]